jgi:anti-anti-sigma factor
VSPTAARVVVVGEIDLATAARLRNSLLCVLHAQTPPVLYVDLAAVTFLDCAGIRAIVAVHADAVQANCQLRVTHPHPNVHRVLELTGLLDVLTAPIGREPLPTETGNRPGSATATAVQPPDLMIAA